MKKNLNQFKLIVTLFLFGTLATFAQNKSLKQFESKFDQLDYITRLTELKKFTYEELSTKDRALFEHLSGKTEYLNSSGSGAVEHFVKAKELYLQVKDYDKVAELLVTLAEQKSLSNYKYSDYKPLLDEAIIYAEKSKNPTLLCNTYRQIGKSISKFDKQKSINLFNKAIAIARENNLYVLEAKINGNIGVAYFLDFKDYKKAREYQNLSLEVSKKHNYQEGIAYAYVNLASICRKEGNYEKALKYYELVESLKFDNYRANVDIIVTGYISDTYREMKNYKMALEYLDKKKELEKGRSDLEDNKIIRDINTKYETQKKELENKELKIKDQKNKLILYSILGVFLLFAFGAYLRISHINKKKKIAEQEKVIESQKLENVLKEQELHEIDKLLEGQEKERIKIAHDLHDNLGSILATLRLNFQSLYNQNSTNSEEEKELFDKTDDLIEEAYQKVRGMAHAKNAGVIGNEGLVKAVQNIAKKVAIPGKLKVEVIPFGMNERLDNALEVTLFRMVQEILTNTIKHAEATEITISLTQDEESINIIIEDNGKGFDPKTVIKNEGMGLSNIEKKTEQLNGSFNIDSFEGKGTSIIIDIPL